MALGPDLGKLHGELYLLCVAGIECSLTFGGFALSMAVCHSRVRLK